VSGSLGARLPCLGWDIRETWIRSAAIKPAKPFRGSRPEAEVEVGVCLAGMRPRPEVREGMAEMGRDVAGPELAFDAGSVEGGPTEWTVLGRRRRQNRAGETQESIRHLLCLEEAAGAMNRWPISVFGVPSTLPLHGANPKLARPAPVIRLPRQKIAGANTAFPTTTNGRKKWGWLPGSDTSLRPFQP